jgi:acid phosphatase
MRLFANSCHRNIPAAMMKPFRVLARLALPAFLALGLANCATIAPSREPGNLSEAKLAVGRYVESGRYHADLAAVATPAKQWILRRAQVSAKNPSEKLAIVFDIDETTLSNLKHMQGTDWGYQSAVWDEWVKTSSAPAILPLRDVYETAVAHKIAVFFITGRKELTRRATVQNLRAQGMGTFEELIVRPNDSKNSALLFKTAERKRIADQGFTIIANLGDQQSDLAGGYAERTFKLPNPFYLIP